MKKKKWNREGIGGGVQNMSHVAISRTKITQNKNHYSELQISNTVSLANDGAYSCLPPPKVFGNYSNLLDNSA